MDEAVDQPAEDFWKGVPQVLVLGWIGHDVKEAAGGAAGVRRGGER